MSSGLNIDIARREQTLAVDWSECSWIPSITVQTPAIGLERGVYAASTFLCRNLPC
jgi:hypothetical protein